MPFVCLSRVYRCYSRASLLSAGGQGTLVSRYACTSRDMQFSCWVTPNRAIMRAVNNGHLSRETRWVFLDYFYSSPERDDRLESCSRLLLAVHFRSDCNCYIVAFVSSLALLPEKTRFSAQMLCPNT